MRNAANTYFSTNNTIFQWYFFGYFRKACGSERT